MAIVPDCTALGAFLQREQALVKRLDEILQAEHAAICRRDTDALQQLVNDKQALLSALEQSHQERLQMLQTGEYQLDLSGFSTLLEGCADADADLFGLWDEIRSELEICQQQNQKNGSFLESSRRLTHQALSILLGGEADPSLYDQSGRTTAPAAALRRGLKA